MGGPEPQGDRIQDLVYWDPVSAYAIVRGVKRLPWSWNIKVTFSTFAVGAIAEGDSDTTLNCRTWVDNMTYRVDVPNVFAGNIFKAQFDAELRKNTGVDMRLESGDCPRFAESITYTPLENVINVLASRWPKGWRLDPFAGLRASFLLVRPPPAVAPNGPPYIVTVTFNGWTLGDPCFDEMSDGEARCCLRKLGCFCVPYFDCDPCDPPPGLLGVPCGK